MTHNYSCWKTSFSFLFVPICPLSSTSWCAAAFWWWLTYLKLCYLLLISGTHLSEKVPPWSAEAPQARQLEENGNYKQRQSVRFGSVNSTLIKGQLCNTPGSFLLFHGRPSVMKRDHFHRASSCLSGQTLYFCSGPAQQDINPSVVLRVRNMGLTAPWSNILQQKGGEKWELFILHD